VTACYLCGAAEAGNDYAGPYSAYCAGCQPRDARPLIGRSQAACADCERVFATVTDFDRHHDQWGCLNPASIGLEDRAGVWGTPEGNRRRDAKAEQIRQVARARGRGRSESAREGGASVITLTGAPDGSQDDGAA
jgi:hypothetical protein